MASVLQHCPEYVFYPGVPETLSDNETRFINKDSVILIPSSFTVFLEHEGKHETIQGARALPCMKNMKITVKQIAEFQVQEKSRYLRRLEDRVEELQKRTNTETLNPEEQKVLLLQKEYTDRVREQRSRAEHDIYIELEKIGIEIDFLKPKRASPNVLKRLARLTQMQTQLHGAFESEDLVDGKLFITGVEYQFTLQDLQEQRRNGLGDPKVVAYLQYKATRLRNTMTSLQRAHTKTMACPAFQPGVAIQDAIGRRFQVDKNGVLHRIYESHGAPPLMNVPTQMVQGCPIGAPMEMVEKRVAENVTTKMPQPSEILYMIFDEKSFLSGTLLVANHALELVEYSRDPNLLFTVSSGTIRHQATGEYLDIDEEDMSVIMTPHAPDELTIARSPKNFQYLYTISKMGLHIQTDDGERLVLRNGLSGFGFFIIPLAKK